jgi:hypothetical protein
MKTPKEFQVNLKQGIITKEMLGACLYSVNKRAKNCRDKEREYRSRYRYNDKYDTAGKYMEKKNEYYSQKDMMLTLLEPDCIHAEPYEKRVRYYDYEEEFETYADKDLENCGCYWDRDLKTEVYFVDAYFTEYRYYLFYDFKDFSFHTPINEEDLEKYKELEVKKIGYLVTKGHDVDELISIQFVKKLLLLIENNKFTYVSEIQTIA